MAEDSSKKTTLAVIVGRNVRRLRDARGWSQSDLAREAQDYGLTWGQTVVSAIEKGARVLDLDELLLLCVVLRVGPQDLLAGGDGEGVWLAHIPMSLDLARTILSGEGNYGIPQAGRWVTAVPGENDSIHWKTLWPGLDADGWAQAVRDSVQDAEKKAGRSLTVSPLDVATAAHGLWGRSLTAERDARVSAEKPSDADDRTIQGLKGHTTRKLIDELKRYMEQRVPVPWLAHEGAAKVP
jgi:transcriptional regulator with XRE-family HTH domain